jgi:uncharacterized membrane protein
MDKLSVIFENPDAAVRKAELNKLAKALNIKTAKFKNEKGELDENRLAVLIFEELREGRQKKRQHAMLVILAIVFIAVSLIGVYIASKALVAATRPSQQEMSTQEE